MGLEPTRVSAKVFETSLYTIPTLRHMVRDTGLEPARVSSTGPKPAAYAIRLIPHMVMLRGLEPRISGLKGRRLCQFDYSTINRVVKHKIAI